MQEPLDGEGGDHKAGHGGSETQPVFGDALYRAARRLMQRHRYPPTRAHSQVVVHASWEDATFLTD